jgi:hypothetical protein
MGHHESEETYLAIGRFIFEFSQLEHSLRVYIGEKLNLGEDLELVVMSHDFSMLCTTATKVLAVPGNADADKALTKMISECRRINDVRVRVSHGLWVPFRSGGTVHQISRRTLTQTMSINQAQELVKCADETAMLRYCLDCYMWDDYAP